MSQNTEFEKKRGVSHVEVRPGFAQAHLANLGGPIADRRLQVLRAVADAGISLDFLKMTPMGLSFLIPEVFVEALGNVLGSLDLEYSLRERRSVVLVHAVNIRDEEGLIARILGVAVGGGTIVHHLSDMHDRVLMVVDSEEAPKLAAMIEEQFVGVTHAN